MKSTRLLCLILVLSCTTASAQLMNVRKWRPSERDSLDKALELFDEKMFLRALPIFETLLEHHPKEEFLKYSYAKCALYRADKHEVAYTYFTEIYNNNKKVPDIQYDMALAALYNYKFDEATNYIDQYADDRRTSAEGKANAVLVKRNISNAKYYLANPTNAKVTNMGSAINSSYDEYVPAITADESALIFTYAGSKSLGGRQNEDGNPDRYGNFMEDIYISYKKDNEFQPAVPIDSLNTKGPNSAISLSEDGTVLFIYQDIDDGHGDIYQSFLQGDHFTKPKKVKGEVNSYSWDGHCSISPDGRTLYFSSERTGGLGGRDLYKATLSLPDSVWTNAVNLGDSINTPYDDDAPFIHSDGVTLFYSSKGRTSMGGYDIFRAVMRPEDSTFKKTENLGYPINSTSDDIYFVLGASGNRGYYSSGKKEGRGMKDIYAVEPNFNWPKPSLYLVKGKVLNGMEGVEANIRIEITSKNNALFKTLKSNSKTGEYLVSLPPGVSYLITYSYKNLPEQRLNINAVDLNGYMEKVNDVNFQEKVDVLASNTTNQIPSKKAEPELKKPAATPALNTAVAAASKTTAAITEKETTNLAVASKTEKPVTPPKEPEVTDEVINHVPVAVNNSQQPAVGSEQSLEGSGQSAGNSQQSSEGSRQSAESSQQPVASTEQPAVNKTPEIVNLDKPSTEAVVSNATVSTNPRTNASRPSVPAAWDFTTRPVTSTPLNLPESTTPAAQPSQVSQASKDFVPVNGPQIKSMKFTEKYGNASADEMEFRVQVAAVKNDNNTPLPNQKMLGKVEKLNLNDGFTRITVGGAFKTLAEALEHNKKVVKAGQKEGFIIALYKGKRVSLDELEKMGLLK